MPTLDWLNRAEALTAADGQAPGSLLRAYVGQPRYSLANWLALHELLMIVDEAHNARTETSFLALKRLNPSAILELTATPTPHRTNALYHVSAQTELLPLEREAVLEDAGLDLLAHPISLQGFEVVESDNAFEIYMAGRRVLLRQADPHQLALDAVDVHIGSDDLVRWLDREVAQPDVPQPQMRAWLAAVVAHLLNERRVPLNTLARMRFVLAQSLVAQIEDLRQAAMQGRFRQLVLDGGWNVEPDWLRPFVFEPGRYAAYAGSRYQGRWEFKRHYYPVEGPGRGVRLRGRNRPTPQCAALGPQSRQ